MSIWQTKKWGEMLIESKQAEKIFEIDNVFIEKRKVAMGEYGLFVLGIKVDQLNKKIVKKLENLVKKEKALFMQIETLDYNEEISLDNNFFHHWKISYYKKFITPYTAIINLEKSQDEILDNMKPKGRYNIRLAEKKGVTIKIVKKSNENIEIFFNLMNQTTSRDGFFGNNLEYYKIFLSKITKSKLIFSYFEDKVIAAGIFIFDKESSIYYYGASTSEKKYRNLMAPYLLQWEAIKYAKSIGSKIYDFLGISTPGEKKSSLSGVTGFKMKLTKDVRWVSNSRIFVNKKTKYFFIQLLRKIKK